MIAVQKYSQMMVYQLIYCQKTLNIKSYVNNASIKTTLRAKYVAKPQINTKPYGITVMYVKSANRFNECVEATIGFEGEYSDHPNDSGGRTKYGITASTLESAKTKGWVPSNVTIKNLKLDHAKTIYKKGYWDVVKADSLPHPLDLIIFDMAVNHGVNSAIKLLQKTLNSMSGFNLVVDGIIGQKTMTAIDKLTNTDHLRCLCAHVLLNRVELYTSIIQGNKTQERFFKGWVVNRVVKLKQEVGL